MNCFVDPEKLALYAGGDLSTEETAELSAHIEKCRHCSALLDELLLVRDMAGFAAGRETPPLPDDFTGQVMSTIVTVRARRRFFGRAVRKATWFRIAAAAAILAAVFWSGRFSLRTDDTTVTTDNDSSSVQSEIVRNAVTVDGAFLRMLPVIGPLSADVPLPAVPAGVYLVLSRPEPVTAPDKYAVEYVGECTGCESDDILREYEHIGTRSLSRDTLFIVLYPMPSSSFDQRERVAQALIQAYRSNDKNGV